MLDDVYVYEYYTQDTDQVFYVGKGTADRYRRVKGSARSDEFKQIYNSRPCAVRLIKEHMSDEEACRLEMERITLARQDPKCILTNKTKGGEPGHTYDAPPEYRAAVSARIRGRNNPNYGNRWSNEQKRRMSERVISTGRVAGVNNPRCRRIMCVETGKIYDYMDLAKEELGLKATGSFYVALKYPQRTARGFHWVDGDNIERLNTPELRLKYLQQLPTNKKHKVIVPLDSDV